MGHTEKGKCSFEGKRRFFDIRGSANCGLACSFVRGGGPKTPFPFFAFYPAIWERRIPLICQEIFGLMSIRIRMGKKGFTLIELMIVVAIIGILAAIAIPQFISFKKKAQISTAVANLELVRAALSQYMTDNPDTLYPTNAEMIDYGTMVSTLDSFGLTCE